MKLAALLLVTACHSGTQPLPTSPTPSTAPLVQPSPKPAAMPASRFTFADPRQSTTHVELTAKLVAADTQTALCGNVHWGSVVEYEVVSVQSGTLTGQHFLAVVGCIDLPRTSYDTNAGSLVRFQIGAVHKLLISTDSADSRGLTDPPTATPHFYVISADPA